MMIACFKIIVQFIYVARLINNSNHDVQDLVFPCQQKFVMKDLIADRKNSKLNCTLE